MESRKQPRPMGNTRSSGDERHLEREHRPRTLKAGSELEPRPSVADEQLLTEQVHDHEAHERELALRQVQRRLRIAESELKTAMKLLPVVDRQTRRDLARIRQALERITERHIA
jgi:hypothetical protein